MDIMIILNADEWYSPEDIPRPVKSILQGKADIIIGARLLSESSKSLIPGYRRVGIRSNNLYI